MAVVLGKTTASVFILPPHSISCSGTDNYPKVYSREGMQAQIPQAQTIRYIDTLDLLLQRRSKDCECSPPPTPGEFFSHVEICMMNACKKMSPKENAASPRRKQADAVALLERTGRVKERRPHSEWEERSGVCVGGVCC